MLLYQLDLQRAGIREAQSDVGGRTGSPPQHEVVHRELHHEKGADAELPPLLHCRLAVPDHHAELPETTEDDTHAATFLSIFPCASSRIMSAARQATAMTGPLVLQIGRAHV